MTDRGQNIYDMFVRTLAYNVANAGDYGSIAAAATNFATVQAAVDALEIYSTQQTSGEGSAAVEQKSVLRAAIRRKMTTHAKTARALNLDTPGFAKMFSVPDSDNDDQLIATGREFVLQAIDHKTALDSLGIPFSNSTDLTADLDAFEAAQTAKATAQSVTVGATAGIDDQTDAVVSRASIVHQ
ncbi:MAG: hypothetical protein ACKVQJ_09950 [Pyrinomonadaceae bacterium]